jgi:hypothetical protein
MARTGFQTVDTPSHPRGAMRPSFAPMATLERKRAQGKPDARCTRGLVCKWVVKKRTRAYRSSGGNPAFPARWVTAYSELSPVTGLSCHRRPRELLLPANLTPASGRQDHTASPSATAALVVRRLRVHRIPPRVRDDRDPPLSSGETGKFKSLICPGREAEYFLSDGWTGFADLPGGLFCRRRHRKIALAREAKQSLSSS